MDKLRRLLEDKLQEYLTESEELDMKDLKDAAAILRELRDVDRPETAERAPVRTGGVVELG